MLRADSIKLKPIEKISVYKTGIGNNKTVTLTGNLNTTNIIATAIKEKRKLTNPKRHFSKGKIYLGIYTFFISDDDPKTEVSDELVVSAKNEKRVEPVKK